MKIKYQLTQVLAGILLTATAFAQSGSPKELLGVAGPVVFDKVSYDLAWTSHPSGNYYKQEYLAKGDTIEKFKQLILLEALTGSTKLNDIVAAKVAELKQMKAANPLVDYKRTEKAGEVILDFVLTANTPDGKHLSIVERNVYRYKSTIEKNGQKAVLLFGVSERAYGADIDTFLADLKTKRSILVNAVSNFVVPAIAIAKQ